MKTVRQRILFILNRRNWYRKDSRLRSIMERMEAVTGHKVSHEAVSKWLNGKKNPDRRNIERLAAVLEVDESWLLFGV